VSAQIAAAPVRVLPAERPLFWLAMGWRDFLRAPLPSLVHGLIFVIAGAVIVAIGWGRYELLAGAFSGFLLVAPMLVAGLYEVSRRLARGERPTMRDVIRVWIEGGACMVRMGFLLALLGTLWVGLSTMIIVGLGGMKGAGIGDFMRDFVLSPNWLPFLLWLVAGGIFAAVVFGISVVSVPMLLDRDVNLPTAALTSVRVVGTNPVPMVLWAALVMMLTLLGIALVLPMLVVVPVLGHATWHAYSDSVDSSHLAPRF
jgi:uncharacterized membrane protein